LEAVKKTWYHRFRELEAMLVDFENAFTTKFDIDEYSVMHEVLKCKVRKQKQWKTPYTSR
jgi:hypothetical protein